MPRDLFGDVVNPSVRVGSRKWYTVPLSLAVHTVVVLTVIVVPLLATGVLPMPRESVTFAITPLDIPAPPPVRRIQPQTTQAVNHNAAPVEQPTTIEKETGFEPGFETGVKGGLDVTDAGLVSGTDAIVAPPPPPKPVVQEPVRVGGHIREPAKIHNVAPIYPPIAQAARIEGVVIIEATIGIDGRVQNARLLRSVPMLDEAALAAVRQWIFTPTTLNGVPVPVIMTVTVHFKLQ